MTKSYKDRWMDRAEAVIDGFNEDAFASRVRPADVTDNRSLAHMVADLIQEEVLNALHEVDKQIRLRKGWTYAWEDDEDLYYKVFESCLGAVNEIKKDIQFGPKQPSTSGEASDE